MYFYLKYIIGYQFVMAQSLRQEYAARSQTSDIFGAQQQVTLMNYIFLLGDQIFSPLFSKMPEMC